MQFYAKIENGIIKEYTNKEDVDSGLVKIDYSDLIDYKPVNYNGIMYTQEKFAEIEKTAEYIVKQLEIKKDSFDFESKQFETDASYIEYKGKIKTLRATFLLIVAKAKVNLKLVEDALYDADNQYDPLKSLEENIAKIKGIFDAIDKIFND